MLRPHNLSPDQCLEKLGSHIDQGLRTEQVATLRHDHGINQLHQGRREPWYVSFLRQFRSIIILVLFIAAGVSAYLDEVVEAIAITAIVFLNALVGFMHESRADRALEKLKDMSSPTAKVIRNGIPQSIPASELVPGDIVDVEAGDLVPADLRLLQSYQVQTQEASLTGESTPVDKDASAILPIHTALAERLNMLYTGTSILSGKALAVVCSTGMSTELGRIAGMLERQKPVPTPLQRRLDELGRLLLVICLILVFLIGIVQYLRGTAWNELLVFSISLAVAAVPEGLAAVVSVALALGVSRMAHRNALIRRLPSVETLGSVNVICSDKTGTLTRNEMTVREIYCDGRNYRVSGSGYNPTGEIAESSSDQAVSHRAQPVESLRLCMTIATVCNHARLVHPASPGMSYQIQGDPTEAALLVAAAKYGLNLTDQQHIIIDQLPFDSHRKMMSLAVQTGASQHQLFTKGAPESVLHQCSFEWMGGKIQPLTNHRRQLLDSIHHQMADRALRVLAVAFRDYSNHLPMDQAEADLCFVGFFGMIDPPRLEVRSAIQRCRSAGIKPVMMTGDHPATARAIALELGIADQASKVVSGKELDALKDDELIQKVNQISVYARVSPEHKLRVVRAWQKLGMSCAMTGDGVNDAPALKAADIGVAMGITGTDVSKEASTMILLDDNFSSIVNAVEEGRGIMDNIQNILRFLISGNSAELLLVIISLLLGGPVPLLPIQILWINLITDGFPALALAGEKPAQDAMRRSPRPRSYSILNWELGRTALFHGGLIAAVSLLALYLGLNSSGDPTDPLSTPRGQAAAFGVCSMSQLFFAMSCRSRHLSLIRLGAFSNPVLILALGASIISQIVVILWPPAQKIFLGQSLRFDPALLFQLLVLSLIPLVLIEILKILNRDHRDKNNPSGNYHGEKTRN